ncbi:AMP-binding protein [Sporanaerobacter acetigenes]|uniref:Long-chain acyl-CoA synthetase n=1 Tax=Sporanaerobacter acetigenes DSM 13106 TaxID=1123281 RepID=A0A1M5ZAN6_9FIRM|nr:AMP-binding protein [Sporanaerobacter acetigenes]SHI21284.1 long-chain acyl-CoA synthetase [Sporanaerobacter acetigenes DSM 13106]
MNISKILTEASKKYPHKVAIYDEDKEISYENLENDVNKISNNLLKLNVKIGDIICIMLENNLNFIKMYFAISRIGGIIIPINPMCKKQEINYILNNSNARIIIINENKINLMEELLKANPSIKLTIITEKFFSNKYTNINELMQNSIHNYNLDFNFKSNEIAQCIYTSGTTRKPKGVLLSHSNLIFDCSRCVERVKFNDSDKHIAILPFFHSFGIMSTILTPIYSGGSIILISKFNPEAMVSEIKNKRATILSAVPSILNFLLNYIDNKNIKCDFNSLRLIISGGGPLNKQINFEYKKRYNLNIIEGNGPTETSPVSYINPPNHPKMGSVGLPLRDVKIKIVDEKDQKLPIGKVGEICIKGPNVMMGYLNDQESTLEAIKDNWYHTGDLGKIDGDGYIFIVGRKKDLILVGEMNVYPEEIEDCINSHSNVLESAVIGVANNKYGQIPIAFVKVLKKNITNENDILMYCFKRLSNYKCPQKVIFVDDIPKNVMGKIDKKQLFESYKFKLI